jgi:hypothetical protein
MTPKELDQLRHLLRQAVDYISFRNTYTQAATVAQARHEAAAYRAHTGRVEIGHAPGSILAAFDMGEALRLLETLDAEARQEAELAEERRRLASFRDQEEKPRLAVSAEVTQHAYETAAGAIAVSLQRQLHAEALVRGLLVVRFLPMEYGPVLDPTTGRRRAYVTAEVKPANPREE